MSYLKQVLTVTRWEYQRFFKLKNELLGIVIMALVFGVIYVGGNYLKKSTRDKVEINVLQTLNPELIEMLRSSFEVTLLSPDDRIAFVDQISSAKKGIMLSHEDETFTVQAWKKPGGIKKLRGILNEFSRQQNQTALGISDIQYQTMMQPAALNESYIEDTSARSILTFFFAGLMIMAVLLSFSYQFTAITGEKQLRITEQIVSALKPQVWMDGKILGITLTGLSSVLTYSVISILGGMLFYQFTNIPVSMILEVLHLPSILIFLAYTLVGIMMWNAIMAAIASVITDPNNSGKSSLMMVPLLFVIAALVIGPHSTLAPFLSWFPLTSATSMPMRWVVSTVHWWELPGSLLVLILTFYLLRRLAARIFRVSILMSGKEPSWKEVFKSMRADR